MNAFRKAVDDLERAASEKNMQSVVNTAKRGRVADEDLARLATILGGTYRQKCDSTHCDFADVASTGGPTSLSTLICPLYLRAFGHKIPKVAVPGRPAGGVDVMAQIPGFKFELNSEEFKNALAMSGYAHCLAQKDFAPLDARFFSFRQSVGAQAIGSLAIASLLAKKVALRINCVGLDVRVAPHGNFGSDWETARNNAGQFCRVAKLLNINSVCVLTGGSQPYQPFLGRGESLLALHTLLEGNPCQSLAAHDNLCFRIARATGSKQVASRPGTVVLRKCFRDHLEAQGAKYDNFANAAGAIREAPRFDLVIRTEGVLTIDLGMLRSLLVHVQNYTRTKAKFADPCGVVFRVPNGSYVWPGDTVASFRAPASVWKRLAVKLSKAFTAVEQAGVNNYVEEVRNA